MSDLAGISDEAVVAVDPAAVAETKGPDPAQWPVENRPEQPPYVPGSEDETTTKGPDPAQWPGR